MNRDVEASKTFLESERKNSQRQIPSASSGASAAVQDLIKCFCGVCESLFKRKSIEYALKSNAEEILRDDESRFILRKFAIYRRGNSHFTTPLEEILDCFELSQSILNGLKDLEENRADLDDLCYTVYWEEYLTRAIDEKTTDDFMHDLMRESAIRLETLQDFAIFKRELKKKLNIS